MSRDVQQVKSLPALPKRPEDSHKGTFGSVLIVAGSRGMSGAASLSGLGALRGGAGLVTVAAPASVVPIIAAVEPSYLTLPLEEDTAGKISADSRTALETAIEKSNAIAVGPGLGQSPALGGLVRWLMGMVERPLVVDADGLNLLAQYPAALRERARRENVLPRVLTPHPGEFARLLGVDTRAVQKERAGLAVKFAREHRVVLVLKGHRTVITDGRRLAVNETGNSGMATGGCGDVLTGLIAALLVQEMPPFEAAQLGVHLHGLAGDLAVKELSKPSLIASDIPRYLGRAFLRLEKSRPRRRKP